MNFLCAQVRLPLRPLRPLNINRPMETKNIADVLKRNGIGINDMFHARTYGPARSAITQTVLEKVARLLEQARTERAHGLTANLELVERWETDARAILAEVLR